MHKRQDDIRSDVARDIFAGKRLKEESMELVLFQQVGFNGLYRTQATESSSFTTVALVGGEGEASPPGSPNQASG